MNRKTWIKRICKVCGHQFEVIPYKAKKGRGVFCSNKCRLENLRIILTKKLTMSCEICGKSFEVRPSQRGRFCSRECCNIWQKKRAIPREAIRCKYCDKEFLVSRREATKRKFCSVQCSVAYRKYQTIRGDSKESFDDNTACPGFVYLLSGGGYYKIGISREINQRLAQISPKLPFNIDLIHYFATDDMLIAERQLHNQFTEKRTNGEWFKLTKHDVQYIMDL